MLNCHCKVQGVCIMYLIMYNALGLHTVKLPAVDWSSIQFWTLLAKGHNTQASNFHFINSLKILECATNRDGLLFVTLRYVQQDPYLIVPNDMQTAVQYRLLDKHLDMCKPFMSYYVRHSWTSQTKMIIRIYNHELVHFSSFL